MATDLFTPEPTHYELVFSAPEFQGMRVEMRRMSLGESLALDEMRMSTSAGAEENIKRVRRLAETVAAKIVAWNLADELGQPLPVGVDALLAQEESVMDAIVSSYITAVRGVDAPLDSASPTGAPPPPVSIPMETL